MMIPAQIYEAFCPICGARIEYPLFMASFYNYGTYKELISQTIIRVDLDGIHYLKLDINVLLSDFAKTHIPEIAKCQWINLETTKYCSNCKNLIDSKDLRDKRFCIEEKLDVETIP